ncbi:MAG: hypothetical protein AB1390_08035 [Nitrospirota bacterium]
MPKHVVIKIYENDNVEILKDNGDPVPVADRDVTIKNGKRIGQASWVNENPTCVWYNGKWY